ncbi:MAG: hypothetical protein WCC27_10710 [Acidobacteriaceae bacterium]
MAAGTTDTTRRGHLPGTTPILGVLIALTLTAIGVARHPSAIQGDGTRLFGVDVVLLMIYGIAGLWVRYRGSAQLGVATRVGTMTGFVLGAILVGNHVTELFVPVRNFSLVIGPVFLAVALLGATGSAVMERTRSVVLAAVAGVWCAMVGTLTLLCAGFAVNLLWETRCELWLHQAFAASGLTDAGGFLIRNSLEAASEGLVRMPVMALLLSPIGAWINAWMRKRSRTIVVASICCAFLCLIVGAAALFYANALPRSRRPPFIFAGILLAGVALSAAHPGWSALRQHRRER